MEKFIYLQTYTRWYSAGVVSYLYQHFTLKYKHTEILYIHNHKEKIIYLQSYTRSYSAGAGCTEGEWCYPMERDFFKHFKKCSVTGKFQIKVEYFQVKDTLYPLRV